MTTEPTEPEILDDFETFWKPIVCADGVWDHDQVMKELHDYHMVINEVPKVYMEITRGVISKPHTAADAVLGLHEERCWLKPHPEAEGSIDLAEFVDEGYLSELNRRFLHPLGLKMAVDRDEDGTVAFAGIIDDRDDPEGVWFDGPNQEKAANIDRLWAERAPARIAALGWMVEPV